ncbi:hypothetical protein NPIL_50001 [Nephila pilipes]|uniref:Uncharacterized protein n=1 Tax=Nephila pilipes TaxID=299642 RepID=A0A8X6NM74_NEPPI|nr:hypothetical protein NPIL_50001 [Nephila pilipes]
MAKDITPDHYRYFVRDNVVSDPEAYALHFLNSYKEILSKILEQRCANKDNLSCALMTELGIPSPPPDFLRIQEQDSLTCEILGRLGISPSFDFSSIEATLAQFCSYKRSQNLSVEIQSNPKKNKDIWRNYTQLPRNDHFTENDHFLVEDLNEIKEDIKTLENDHSLEDSSSLTRLNRDGVKSIPDAGLRKVSCDRLSPENEMVSDTCAVFSGNKKNLKKWK